MPACISFQQCPCTHPARRTLFRALGKAELTQKWTLGCSLCPALPSPHAVQHTGPCQHNGAAALRAVDGRGDSCPNSCQAPVSPSSALSSTCPTTSLHTGLGTGTSPRPSLQGGAAAAHPSMSSLSSTEPGNKPPRKSPPPPLCAGGEGPRIPEFQAAATSSRAEPQELSDG